MNTLPDSTQTPLPWRLEALRQSVAGQLDGRALLVEVLRVLNEACAGLKGVRLEVELRHPLLMAVAWSWRRGAEVEEHQVKREVMTSPMYQESPVRRVRERQDREVRVLVSGEGPAPASILSEELLAEGVTDYLALPLPQVGVRDDVVVFATDKPGGFTEGELQLLRHVPAAIGVPVMLMSQQLLTWTTAGTYRRHGETSDEGTASSPESSAEATPVRPPGGLRDLLRWENPSDVELLTELVDRFAAMDLLSTPVWVFDPSRYQIPWANRAALELWRASSLDELARRDFRTSMSAAMAFNIVHTVARLRAEGPFHEWAILEPLGQPKRFCLVHHLTQLVDGTEVIMQEALREPPAQQIVSLAANLALSLALFDDKGELSSCNPAFLELMGERRLSLSDLLEADWDLDYFIGGLSGLHPHSIEVQLACAKGKRWFRIELRKVESTARLPGVLATFYDITEQRLERNELRRLVRTDVLTQVSNRHGVMSDAAAWLEEGELETVIFLDLDGLKKVNDTHGHGFGDRILQASARRMVEVVGTQGLVGRMGGDEFLVVLGQGGGKCAEELREALAQPFDIEGVHLTVTASLGTVVYPEDGRTLEELVNRADMATLGAKRAGRNRVVTFGAQMLAHSELFRETNRHIRKALSKSELRLVAQPIVDLEHGTPVRAECLLRWRSDALGAVSPGVFIPAAEEAGIIVDIGRFAAERACRLVSEAHKRTGRWVPISFNVSARELIDPDYVDHLTAVRDRWGVPPGVLVVEVTETSLIDRLDLAEATLSRLKALGFGLALDDFGTGFSSLSYLHRLPFDIIKIDRSLTSDLPNPRSVAIVQAVITLAEGLGARVVGEGIETDVQRDTLRGLGCVFGQGYLFARPLELDDWLALSEQGSG